MEGVETGKHKEKYLKAKKKVRRTVYQAKQSRNKRFGNAMQQDDQKYDVFTIAKMIKTNQNIIVHKKW